MAQLSPMMQYAAEEERRGEWLKLVVQRSAAPPLDCTPQDPACVWRFDVIKVEQCGTLGAVREKCEVHAYTGIVRCGWREVYAGPFVLQAVGNARSLSVDAGT